MSRKPSRTNATTADILGFLTSQGCFVWRENVLPIPIQRKGVFTGSFRSGGKSGRPDIIGIAGPGVLGHQWGGKGGVFLGIEVKTGRDRLRDEQIGFIRQAQRLGAVILVVKDFEDFKRQWAEIASMPEDNPLKNAGFTC